MTYIAFLALAVSVAVLRRYRALQGKLDALREQLRADTRATMRQVKRRHAAGVRGWQTRRAGV